MELSEDLIKRRSKHFDLSCVTLLDLSDAATPLVKIFFAGVHKITHLEKCIHATEINLANNQLQELGGLPSLASLRSLNLSRNKLTSIDDLPSYPGLEELSIAGNQITMIDFSSLAPRLPLLRSLYLQDNPVSSNKDLVALLQKHFPKLLLLNGEAVALFHVRIGDYVLLFLAQDTSGTKTQIPDDSIQFNKPSTNTSVMAGSFIPSSSVSSYDVDAFIQQATKKLEEMIKQCDQLMETGTQRVSKALNPASAS